MGAAGRDFHNFNVKYRNDASHKVVCFTATQIPDIEGRTYPPELAGELYPEGIPILPEDDLPKIIKEYDVDEVVFAYSDVSHEYVMHRASVALASGSDFVLLGPKSTMLKSSKPVIAIGAVRTGSGKSQTTRKVCSILKDLGLRVSVVRHPMPYGDLRKQICQRFETYADLDKYECTIEEREEYEPHIDRKCIVWAGVDYELILRSSERESDVVVWDGGNNDFPFYEPDLFIVVADPHRRGHETTYHPGETNLLMADIIIINKVDTADPADVEALRETIRTVNPRARVIEAASPIQVSNPDAIRGKRVLVIEDGPTLTHGGMSYGAGVIASKRTGAAELIDPRPFAVGSIREAYERYGNIGPLLPAMGYSRHQIRELEETINRAPCDVVVSATPIDITRVARIEKPVIRITYELEERTQPGLSEIIRSLVEKDMSKQPPKPSKVPEDSL
ncbi:MAG TPA: GTPase [Clostridia bacterium]|nr:GTPase [Clostridia bacterium]